MIYFILTYTLQKQNTLPTHIILKLKNLYNKRIGQNFYKIHPLFLFLLFFIKHKNTINLKFASTFPKIDIRPSQYISIIYTNH